MKLRDTNNWICASKLRSIKFRIPEGIKFLIDEVIKSLIPEGIKFLIHNAQLSILTTIFAQKKADACISGQCSHNALSTRSF
jgi:hypothetical protein